MPAPNPNRQRNQITLTANFHAASVLWAALLVLSRARGATSDMRAEALRMYQQLTEVINGATSAELTTHESWTLDLAAQSVTAEERAPDSVYRCKSARPLKPVAEVCAPSIWGLISEMKLHSIDLPAGAVAWLCNAWPGDKCSYIAHGSEVSFYVEAYNA